MRMGERSINYELYYRCSRLSNIYIPLFEAGVRILEQFVTVKTFTGMSDEALCSAKDLSGFYQVKFSVPVPVL